MLRKLSKTKKNHDQCEIYWKYTGKKDSAQKQTNWHGVSSFHSSLDTQIASLNLQTTYSQIACHTIKMKPKLALVE